MAGHKITIEFDDEAGTVAVVHRTSVRVGEHVVSHAEPVELDDAEAVKASLKGLVDSNRETMEQAASRLAVQHAAALSKGPPPAGVQRIAVGGSLGMGGGAAAEKK